MAATALDNGTQVTNPFEIPETHPKGFFESIRIMLTKIINGLVDFITGDTCRNKCSSFFDFSLLLALFPTTCVLLWLLRQKGLFDPFYDWWEDHFDSDHHRRLLPTREDALNRHHHHHHHHRQHQHGVKTHYHHRRTHERHKHHHNQDDDVLQKMLECDHNESHYYHQLHRVHTTASIGICKS